MHMQCVWDEYQMDIGWMWNGYGMGAGRIRNECGMDVDMEPNAIGMTSNGYGIDTGCTWIDMGERTWNVCNGHEIDVEWAWNAHRMDMEMIWDEHGMDMGD